MQIKKVVSLHSRTGRLLQRYNQGCRQVVGCIPYRIRKTNKPSPIHGTFIEDLEVLLISSQKSPRMMFPKGGWEVDEDIELAASRETLEEAGVVGLLGDKLGEWIFKSKSQEKFHEGSMFPLFVTEELDVWPEKNVRKRVWMTISEAKEKCAHSWMKEALDAFALQFTPLPLVQHKALSFCRIEFCKGQDLRLITIGPQSTDEDVDCYLISLITIMSTSRWTFMVVGSTNSSESQGISHSGISINIDEPTFVWSRGVRVISEIPGG